MKQSKFDQTRDQRIADESGPDKQLMCTAHDCPNLWSTSDGQLCRWHADAPANAWPQVTHEQQDAVTDRALYAQSDRPECAAMSLDDRRAILAMLRMVLSEAKNPRAWIGRLREKQQRGDALSPMQKFALEQVKDAHEVLDHVREGGDVPRRAITTALQRTGDLPSSEADGPPAWMSECPTFDEADA